MDALNTERKCEPCTYSEKNVVANCICSQCKEYMCSDCRNHHLSEKQSKNHKIKSIEEELMCGPCHTNGKTNMATSYCQDCADPEALCTACAARHNKYKTTKEHRISSDMNTYLIRYHLQDVHARVVTQSDGDEILYERKKETKQVTHECNRFSAKSCRSFIESQESLNNCQNEDSQDSQESLKRKRDKEFASTDLKQGEKDHKKTKISDDIVIHKQQRKHDGGLPCKRCRDEDRTNIATVYCTYCEIPLCTECSGIHKKNKKTEKHTISNDLTSCILASEQKANQTAMTDDLKMGSDSRPIILTTQTVNSSRIDGPPYSTECRSNRISLQWVMTGKLLDHEAFQIMFKESPESQSAIWKSYNTDSCFQPRIEILGLTPKTSYVFKVRIFNKRTGEEFPFTDECEHIKTQESPAKHVLKKSKRMKTGSPAIYTLSIKENRAARNTKAKTRKFHLGTESVGVPEKTLMIMGATGSGKSTLINAIANYIIGVEWEDDFRFNLINLEPDERKRSRNEAQSLTQWVTCYTLHSSVSDRINYTINLIDTPGFGDTRGLEHDAKIIDQIRELFTAQNQKGISTLDAVCFIVKAPDARLTPTQTYIFESILSLFGKDIKDNICTLITFADGQTPPVLAGIKALYENPLPCENYFTFNNSALYATNSEGANNQMSSFFWQMGMKSYQTFLSHVANMQTRSLWLTAEVLENRQKLENTIYHLHQEIDVGLCKIRNLEIEVKIFSENSRDILANKDFEYTVEEDYQEKIDLQGTGKHTTNCLTCNFTCHENCRIANDDGKARCIAMNSEGSCMECPNECHWTEHHNTPFVIKWFKRNVKKRYEDMKRKYEEATQKTLTQEQVLDEMSQDITQQQSGIQVLLEIISKQSNRLKEIALRPDPLSTVDYIDIMISSEELEKKSGFEARINALKECKKRAEFGNYVQIFEDKFRKTKKSIAASDIADEVLKSDKSIIGRIKRYFR